MVSIASLYPPRRLSILGKRSINIRTQSFYPYNAKAVMKTYDLATTSVMDQYFTDGTSKGTKILETPNGLNLVYFDL
jgi:hypothetical protein